MQVDFDTLGMASFTFTRDGILVKENRIDKIWKEQRPHRARIIVAGIRKKKSNDEIEEDLRSAGLLHSNHWVDRWVRYYKWKISLGEI